MKFKVHLLKNSKPDSDKSGLNLSEILEDLKLKYQVYRWGLNYAFAGENIARVRLNSRVAVCSKTPGYGYELNLYGDDYKTRIDMLLGRVRKQFAIAGIGLVSFVALLGIGGEKAEASQKVLAVPSVSKEGAKVSSPAISHADIDSYMQDAFPGEYMSEKFQLAYYHSNSSSHTNTGGTHVNNPHSDNASTHTNTWTNAQTHQNTWNNVGHQNLPSPHSNLPGGVHANVSGGSHVNVSPNTHSNTSGGTHANTHSNTIPGDYIY